MIVVDASALFTALDRSQPQYSAVRRAIESERGPLLLSPFVLAEVDHFVVTRVGIEVELRLLRDVASGSYQLEPFTAEDLTRAIQVIERYSDLGIGLADASIVVIADRAGTDRILTLDERHFRALRPLRGGAFKLLPADS